MAHNGAVMSTTKLRDASPHLQDRYGYRRAPASTWVAAGLAALFIAGFGLLAAEKITNPPVTVVLLSSSPSPDHMRIIWEVHRTADKPTECALRVQNYSHHDVGYAIVTIPAGTTFELMNYDVATNSEGFAGEVLGCAPVGDLHAAAPEFPPGTSNPPQPWRKS